MIISCVGDSLTEGDYGIFGKRGIPNVHEDNYPKFLAQMLGAEVRNFGKCGYTATSFLEHYEENKVYLSGSDVIIVMLGTNGDLDTTDPNAKGNLDYTVLLEKCKSEAPLSKIILCTPPHVTENPNLIGFGLAQRVSMAQEYVREYARKNKYPLIDVALCEDFTAENESIMQPNDGIHLSKEGYYALARFITKELKNIINL